MEDLHSYLYYLLENLISLNTINFRHFAEYLNVCLFDFWFDLRNVKNMLYIFIHVHIHSFIHVVHMLYTYVVHVYQVRFDEKNSYEANKKSNNIYYIWDHLAN